MNDSQNNSQLEVAIVGGGCFWCLEAVYQRLNGVQSVVSGYAGGRTSSPTYKDICTGNTGHAEVIKVEFNPEVASFSDILDLFWQAHDPTTLNRQGADTGTQYRSIILTTSDEQVLIATDSKTAVQKHFSNSIVTEITPLNGIENFWSAEDNHQNFYNNNKIHPYCLFNIIPKLKKLGM